jgi:hypothetical protein
VPYHGDGPVPYHGDGPVPYHGDGPVPYHGDGAVPYHGDGPVPYHGDGPVPYHVDGPTRAGSAFRCGRHGGEGRGRGGDPAFAAIFAPRPELALGIVAARLQAVTHRLTPWTSAAAGTHKDTDTVLAYTTPL